ncbi:diphthine--ammonia ligase isoform X2 [Coffea arabica]|uniref:Diphthine--ammonia ligase n=1 Tax=Coffea arabica TaxID=13443 RepID=A0A6P6W6Z7_COFAR|nr:diphthine--ammonia ligase-like isoform X2 [Coffea arabica]
MKVVALVSGGKDSCYAMMKCLAYGHEIVALANLLPSDDAEDELDSYMYQTVGHQIVVSYAKCMGLPLFRRRIQGSTRHHGLTYSTTPGDEVEDMFILLNEVKQQIPSVAAVSSGAIASDYQRLRVESVCSRLGLVSLAYLWKQDQSLLLGDMIKAGIVAITVKVAAMGLDPSKHLGKEISWLEPHLHKLKELYGLNVCGEGGEYETLTLDCPLFKNAHIVLDEFQIVLHSKDPICPVGILHPLAFHLEKRAETVPLGKSNKNDDEFDLVCEVQGDCQQRCENISMSNHPASKFVDVNSQELQISRTKMDNTFSISCWLQDSSKTSGDLQADLEYVLMKIELQLAECCYSWENVLYIHLYIADMNKFAVANETYIRFITQDKCRFGVPSRSTVELPLSQVGLGMAYIEVLVANDETKRVLHVQSISDWAPSCIGPYSQATLHKDILYMAGQLGLDPPTMLLSSGGPTVELKQALENSEAIAKCFNCSIATSAILFVIYCSASMNESDRIALEKTNLFIKEMKLNDSDNRCSSDVFDPIFLYVLVPDLPKRALVEVKPVLYVLGNKGTLNNKAGEVSYVAQDYCGFQHENWHDECLQKCVVPGRLCAAVLSVTQDIVGKICSKFLLQDSAGCNTLIENQIEGIAKFCVYLLDAFLLENRFSWDDVTTFRLYFATRLHISHAELLLIFTRVFSEFAGQNPKRRTTTDPIFNLVPVLGAGRSANSVDGGLLSCEVFARKL